MSSPRKPGRLRILLGYAAGVGKTYRMLEEAQELKRQGRDVVVGYFEPHGRQDTIAKLEGLELIPRGKVEYRGRVFEEMDTGAILARHPEICAVDEFPHTNIPGSARAKRWEDVMVLIEAGINVITTMNIQHLESLNDQVREISGVAVRETIPDWVVKQADEVILVDLPPRALLNRLQRGVVYGADKAERALQHFFKEPTLAALREMALRQTAHEVETRQEERAGEAPERIMIHVTESPAAAALIRRGKRVADYLKADCFAVAVLPSPNAEQLERHLDFARKLHIETRILESDKPAEALVEFARRNGVTQIFLAKPPRRPFRVIGKRPLAMEVVRLATDRQVTVVAERKH
ncbi:MAG: histidine kinase [Acidobacteriia bacterium]|nr:histidine kinase [Terriglobia bacterium]